MDRINRNLNHDNNSVDYSDVETFQQMEEAYELTKFAAEEADIDLKDVEVLGHIYGIERAEEQFQELCDSFQRLKMVHKMNARPHKKKEALGNYAKAANDYLGSEVTYEDIASNTAKYAGDASIRDDSSEEIVTEEIMNMSRDEFEEMIRDL